MNIIIDFNYFNEWRILMLRYDKRNKKITYTIIGMGLAMLIILVFCWRFYGYLVWSTCVDFFNPFIMYE